MTDLYSNDKVREKAEQLVRQNVHSCVSMLVSSISNGGEGVCKALELDYEDDLLPLLESLDWDEPADNHIRNNWDEFELRSYLLDQGAEFVEVETDDDGDPIEGTGTPTEELRILAITAMQEQGAKEFCIEFNIDPDRGDIYEHWIVDNWFAGKLEEKGHAVARDFLGLTIWGRPTTGQSISMDSVILEIANDILKEYPE